jgi:general secretion pathway protein K
MASSKRFRQRGTALLAVLWLSAALAAIAFSVADTVRAEAERGITNQDGMRAYFLARGAVERMLFTLRTPDPSGMTFEERFRVQRRFYFREVTGDVIVEMVSEKGKVHPRMLSPDLLQRLLILFGEAPETASAIAQQAFNPQISSANPTFLASIASIENVEELLLVPGITPEILYGRYRRLPDGSLVNAGGLVDCVSPHGSQRAAFDAISVHPTLLMASGVDFNTAQRFAETRRNTLFPFGALPILNGTSAPITSEIGETFQIRATARVRTPNGRLSESRRTVALLVRYNTPNPRYFWVDPFQHLRWYDQAYSEVANSNAIWADAAPIQATR